MACARELRPRGIDIDLMTPINEARDLVQDERFR